ncbi:MAG: TonB-dependent receptor [Parvularculaceae bacterium]|nr:TonB-dependent receptor [Parvularculaceae bacterium]
MKSAHAFKRQLLYSGLVSAAAIACSPAFAQTSDQDSSSSTAGFDTIIVTAQQREQSLQEVPISISAFTGDDIEKNKFDDVGDYIARTPNASFVSNGARSRHEISIRGVTNFLTADSALRTSTFGYYVDGFSISGSSVNPPIMDIERIEVLRGPQATYFGRNAIGGGISITSNRPDNEWAGSVTLDYSRFNTHDVEGVVNVPIVNDVLAIRLNAKIFDTDGNITNINPVGGGNRSTFKYFKGSMRFTPNDQLTVDVIGAYVDEKTGMRAGVPSGVFSTFAGGTLYAHFPDRDGDGLADPDPDGVGFYPTNRRHVNFNHPQTVGTKFKYVVSNAQYDAGPVAITSITGYMESDFFHRGDIDGGSKDFFNEFRETPRSSFSQEFRIQNTGSGPFLWNLGLLYANDKGTSTNRTFVGNDPLFGLPVGFMIDRSDSIGSSKNFAVFGQVDWTLLDRLTLSAGGRYSIEKIKQSEDSVTGATVVRVSIDDTFRDFSPRVALRFQVTDDAQLYASAAKGFKSGGVQVSPFPGAETYEPESLWNYEVGAKADLFDNRLRLNAAVFYMDWKDLQTVFQQAGTDASGNLILFGGIENAEKATSKGAELGASAYLSDNLTMNFSVGYLDAKYEKFTSYIDGANRVLDGLTIPNSPKWTLSADAEYRRPITNEWEGFLRAEWNYRDEIRASNSALIRSGFPWEVPSFNVVNMRAGVETENYTVTLYAENIFDNVYFTNAYQKAFAGGLFIEPSFRNFGIRFTGKFQ